MKKRRRGPVRTPYKGAGFNRNESHLQGGFSEVFESRGAVIFDDRDLAQCRLLILTDGQIPATGSQQIRHCLEDILPLLTESDHESRFQSRFPGARCASTVRGKARNLPAAAVP